MDNLAGHAALKGKRLLVLDDEPLLAFDVADILTERGAEVVGPFLTLQDAHAEAANDNADFHGAVLDIQVGKDMVWPLAEQLEKSGTPYVFVSAYCSANELPEQFGHRICLAKPVRPEELESTLIRLLTSNG